MSKLTQEQYNKAKWMGFFKKNGKGKAKPVVELDGHYYDQFGNEIVNFQEWVEVDI